MPEDRGFNGISEKGNEMKAVVYSSYGSADVLQIKDIAKPTPKPHEIVIRNYATTVTAADIMMRKGKPVIGRLYLGLSTPKRAVLGFEFAGEVVGIGSNVTQFAIGDRVYGGTTTLGCYAEYVCVSGDDVLTTMPENITYQEAAPVSGSAITVMNFLKGLGNIRANQKVLINGAAGGLGTYAVQIATHFGAIVTGVCSTDNVEMVKSLGTDRVVDYTKEDFTNNGEQYDIIFDTVGKRSYSECRHSLTHDGIYLSSILNFPLVAQMISTSIVGSKKVKSSSTGLLSVKERLKYFLEITELLKTGKIKTVIGSQYPLEQIAEAHRYVEQGHKKGNAVITV